MSKHVCFRSEVLKGNRKGDVTKGDQGATAYLDRIGRESLSEEVTWRVRRNHPLEELQEQYSWMVGGLGNEVTCLRPESQAGM